MFRIFLHFFRRKTVYNIVLAVLMFVANVSFAQNRAEYKSVYTGGPALQVTAGDYNIVFSERKSWTFREISYKGKSIVSSNGAHQVVLREKQTPDGVDNFLGSAHRQEQIDLIEVIVLDPNEAITGVFPVKEGLKLVTGDSYIVHKKSKFHSEVGGLYYLHEAKITVSKEGIKQNFSFEAVADDYSNVDFMYAFMHMFPKSAVSWLAGNNDIATDEGVFLTDGSFTLNKDVRFFLIYNPQDKIGTALVYPEVYMGYLKKNAFWNRENDNKHYLQIDPKRTKGGIFSYLAMLKVYEADNEMSFKAQGKQLVEKEIGRNLDCK